MASYDPFTSLAQMMASLPDESVESLLVTYETMVDVGDATARPRAAQLLRDSAAGCRNPLRRERLLRAAGDLDARQPAALTPEGLNSRQALAAVAEIDIAHWQPPPDPAPPPPPAPGAAEEEDSEDEEPYMEEAPPQLPHLAVRHFFEGLVVRVAQDLQGADGRAVCSSDLLTVWARQADEDGFTLACRECTVRLRASVAGHAAILENAGNAWFQPVPARECLESLVEAIARQLDRAEEDAGEDDDDRYERKLERIEALRDDVGRCQEWLSQTGERGAAPRCESGKLAAKVFGRDHAVTAWLGLFFAAVPLCME